MRLTKAILASAALSAAAVVGDYSDVIDRVINPVRYNGVAVEENFYMHPFSLHKEYRINKAGNLEVYFGDGKVYPVGKELRVNERSLVDHVKDEAESFFRENGRRIGKFFDFVMEAGQ